jgi:hypothetical protein
VGRPEAALEVVHQCEQADALEGAVAPAGAGLTQDAGAFEPLEGAQHSGL